MNEKFIFYILTVKEIDEGLKELINQGFSKQFALRYLRLIDNALYLTRKNEEEKKFNQSLTELLKFCIK